MMSRLEQLTRLFYGEEVTEGTEVVGTATEALLVSELTKPTTREHLERVFRGSMGVRQGRMGVITDAGFGFRAELKGQGSSSLRNEIHPLLESVFGSFVDDSATDVFTGSTVAAGTSSTEFGVDVGEGASFAVGNAVGVETAVGSGVYEAGWIETIAGDTITLAQALSFGAPAVGANVRPSLTYKIAEEDHPSLSFQQWRDADNYLSYVGCKGNAVIEVPQAGVLPTVNFAWQAMHWAHTQDVGNRPAMTVDASRGTPAIGSKFFLDGVATHLRSLTIDLGNVIARKMSQRATYGVAGLVVADRKTVGSLSVYDEDEAHFTGWLANTQVDLAVQYGTSRFGMVAARVPFAERRAVSYGEDSGQATNEIEFNADISAGSDSVYLAVL